MLNYQSLDYLCVVVISISSLAVQKRKRELVGPEAKRSRSRSPCVASDFKLLTFKPNNPLGAIHTLAQ